MVFFAKTNSFSAVSPLSHGLPMAGKEFVFAKNNMPWIVQKDWEWTYIFQFWGFFIIRHDVKQNQMSWPIVVSHHSSIGWISPAFNQTIMLNETPYILLVGSSSIAVLVGFPSMVGQNIVWLWQLVVHSDINQWQIGLWVKYWAEENFFAYFYFLFFKKS